MTRRRFPLVDVVLGARGRYLGSPVVLAHGVVLELFRDVTCLVPAGVAPVTVVGDRIPSFDGPVDGADELYARAAGSTGQGFLLRAVPLDGATSTPGDPVPASGGYVHPQTTPAATWTVAHGLGTCPPVVLFTSDAPTVPQWTDVTYPDENTIVIEWPVPETGVAYIG